MAARKGVFMKWNGVIWRSVAALVVSVAVCSQAAKADPVLWYNGNWDQRDALANETGHINGLVYENFIVPVGQTWTVTGAWSNDFSRNSIATPTTASWQIRSGVSAGNGGTLLASGSGATTVTATGASSTFGGFFTYFERTYSVSVPSVVLGAGEYWLSVAPNTSGAGSVDSNSLNSTTSGAGSVGLPAGNDGRSYFTSADTGDFFTPTSTIEGDDTQNWDYSQGVSGTVQTSTVVPEPTSMALVGSQLLSVAGYLMVRRRKNRG